MLFNSYVFIFAFLPIVFAGFFLIGKRSPKMAIAWLAFSSVFFYSWWNVNFVALLLCSILFNYAAGNLITRRTTTNSIFSSKAVLTAAIVINLSLLGYF